MRLMSRVICSVNPLRKVTSLTYMMRPFLYGVARMVETSGLLTGATTGEHRVVVYL